MDELEQSCYAAKRYSRLVHSNFVNELSPEERFHYYQHVYFDKNAYIRVFALLDKLGTLLNQLLTLRTERMKAHFSYFTVLRNMRENHLHVELMKPLNELKERHQGAMSRLRGRRNLEIHQMNAELKDDLNQSLAQHGGRRTIENLGSNMEDLDQGWDMVHGSLNHFFRYACKWLRKMD
ncbi:Cthe_2314 family HEPN domain-containing protein [Cohnella cholangitidis]|uniref:Cthe_2314 family HEPN domain-containing protein n=1 Tax=Cohnella cholangitidis TaxID=2598458 RepID=UPI0015FAC8F3|nr:Cthe_2314 family HEPN domain-containing protein [Cohnella cholangitidis]